MAEPVAMRDQVGRTIDGRYRLERFLAEGNFGAVFAGVQAAYGVDLRDVAIKIAKRPMTNLEARTAFGDALEMVKAMERALDMRVREHFVMVYDAGRCPAGGPLADHPYVVMELVKGGSLSSCLAAGKFPLKRAVLYFDQLLRAMAFMHGAWPAGAAAETQKLGAQKVVVHRDLKPANILVVRGRAGEDDLLKVTDFGLAIEVDTLLGWAESVGDLAYLAPESFSQNICSPQSDVYMLGLVFYEMLAGAGLFAEVGAHLRGDTEANRRELRRIHADARRLERFPLLDTHEELKSRPQLARVIRAALEPDASARIYRSAGEMRAAWELAKQGEGPAVRHEAAWEAVRRLTREAERCFRPEIGQPALGDELLAEALEINRDSRRVPDRMVVGRTYLLAVERHLLRGEVERAGALALEGKKRRDCRSCVLALARYYAASGGLQAAALELRAQELPSDWDPSGEVR